MTRTCLAHLRRPALTIAHACCWGVLGLMCLAVAPRSGHAQQQARIIDGEPYDQLELKENSENRNDPNKRIFKLRPFEMKKRRPLERGEASEKLRVRLFDRAQQYEVMWKFVEKVSLFEELVLAQVAEMAAAGRFDDAYEHLLFLEARDDKFPGLSAAFQTCLKAEADYWKEHAEPEQALALLYEIHRRNTKYEGLDAELGAVVDSLVEKHLQEQQYTAARSLLRDLAARFPEHPVVAARQQQIIERATELLTEARTAAKARRLREAYLAASKAVEYWPELEGGKKLLADIQARYRVISVGVSEWPAARTDAIETWGARRQQRLLTRRLAERLPGETAQYGSPLGTWASEGNRAWLILHQEARYRDGARITAQDVLRQLFAVGPGQQPARLWEELIAGGQATDATRLDLELRAPCSHLAALFQRVPQAATGGDITPTGPYSLSQKTADEMIFAVAKDYAGHEANQAQEVLERRILSAAAATGALLSGDIVVYDRIAPRDMALFEKNKTLTVAPYAAPTLHLLLSHPRKPVINTPAFRQAISLGIQRQRLMERVFFDGNEAADNRLTRFAPQADQVLGLPAPEYNPRLMLALLPTDLPPLTLAHPAGEESLRLAAGIRDQLTLAGHGLNVRLKEIDPEADTLSANDWDLLLVAWPGFELRTDLARLTDWCEAGELASAAARRVVLADDAGLTSATTQWQALFSLEPPCIPLWQQTEYYAHRKGLSGIAAPPATLYDTIEKWRYAPPATK